LAVNHNNLTNAFSIDVEDYFQVAAFDGVIQRSSWDSIPLRVESNVEKLLLMLNEANAKATFFTLGWVAERLPQIVRKICEQGHELASHGYGHEKVTSLTPMSFKEDVSKAKKILEDISGKQVVGYRAPSFSINGSNLWAHEVLLETQHVYSSSIYPVKTDLYGMPEAPRFPWKSKGGLVEIPPSTIRIAGRNLPASGGGYFRLLPLWLSEMGFGMINRENNPAIFYCHPWEIDVKQPRVTAAGLKSKFRHYTNLNVNAAKIEKLLRSGQWGRIDQVFGSYFEDIKKK
jgi:polysaccharide deacetylase family protein (PEP-CTERM system associated)